jgi:hypothetical protein
MSARWLVLLVACAHPKGPTTLVDTVDDTPRLVAPGFISTGDDDAHVTMSPDGSTIYWLKDTPSFDLFTIVYSERSAAGWSKPRVAPFSGQWPDGDLVFAPDGKRAYFISLRPVDGKPRTDSEIWSVDILGPDRWGEPRHVAELSSPADEWFPTFTRDGTMYFGSCRDGGLGECDIWRAKQRSDGTFDAPENVGAPINSAANEIEPMIAPDERFIVIAAKGRADSLGSYDLYVSRRAGATWSEPAHLPAPINSTGWEFGPRLSPDGRWLFFTSNRGFGSTPLPGRLDFDELERKLRAPGNGLRDVYVIDARVLER